MIAGSGAIQLIRDKRWMRPLLRVVNAYDRRQVSAYTVADHLANLNNEVHLAMADKSVGPRSIVAWRNRLGGIYKGGGGEQRYSGTARDNTGSASVPIRGRGMDIAALIDTLSRQMKPKLDAWRPGDPSPFGDFDEASLQAELNQLPDGPDEDLR